MGNIDSRGEYLKHILCNMHASPFFLNLARGLENFNGNKDWLDLYVPLLTPTPDKKQVSSKDLQPIRENPHISALQTYLQEPYLILCGCGGAGKSTFLHAINLSLAGGCLKIPGLDLDRLYKEEQSSEEINANPLDSQPMLPLKIDLQDITDLAAKTNWRGPFSLLNYCDAYLKEIGLEGFISEFHEELQEMGIQFLLDGLDDVAIHNNNSYYRVLNELPEFIHIYPKSRVIIAANGDKTNWEQNKYLSGFTVAEISPFNNMQINRFIQRWFEYFIRHKVVDENVSSIQRKNFHNWIDANIEHFQLIQNPLMLTLMVYINISEGEFLPETREELLEKAVEVLIHQWDYTDLSIAIKKSLAHRGRESESLRVDQSELLRRLGQLVYKKTNDSHSHTGLYKFTFINIVSDLYNLNRYPNLIDDLLDKKLRVESGILNSEKPGVYTFPHQLIQNFLLAYHLLENDYPANLVALFLSDPQRWQDVLLLAAERIIRKEPKRVWELIEMLYMKGSNTKAGSWAGYVASKILIKVDYSHKEDGLKVLPQVQRSLVRVLENNSLPAKERACAGVILDKLGDPRFRSDAWFLPDDPFLGFIEISEGKFVMGTREEDIPHLIEDLGIGSDWDGLTLGAMLSKEPNIDQLLHEMDLGAGWENQDSSILMHQWYKREIPQHELWLPTFYIARYPVTTAQFRAFIENSGFQPEIPEGLNGFSNHPLSHVTWSDSLRYCQWLTRSLLTWTGTPQLLKSLLADGWKVTLPSEAEWEKAARGPFGSAGEARIFPWGDEFDPNFGNLKETGLSDTSIVGCFPGGISPYGVLDMAGNVWECMGMDTQFVGRG